MTQEHLSHKQALDHNRNILLALLTRLGISKVCIDYEGYGDSGGAERVLLEPVDLESSLLSESIALWEWRLKPEKDGMVYTLDVDKPLPLENALKLFALDWLSLEHPGWEINEGCRGTVAIMVPDRQCCMEHDEFYTESQHYEHAL